MIMIVIVIEGLNKLGFHIQTKKYPAQGLTVVVINLFLSDANPTVAVPVYRGIHRRVMGK